MVYTLYVHYRKQGKSFTSTRKQNKPPVRYSGGQKIMRQSAKLSQVGANTEILRYKSYIVVFGEA